MFNTHKSSRSLSGKYFGKFTWCKELTLKIYGEQPPGIPVEDERIMWFHCEKCKHRIYRVLRGKAVKVSVNNGSGELAYLHHDCRLRGLNYRES